MLCTLPITPIFNSPYADDLNLWPITIIGSLMVCAVLKATSHLLHILNHTKCVQQIKIHQKRYSVLNKTILINLKPILEQITMFRSTLTSRWQCDYIIIASYHFFQVQRHIYIITNSVIVYDMPAGASRNDERNSTLFVEGLLVEHVLAKTRTNAFQVGDVLRHLLDGLHLLIEELTLQPVSHLTTTNNSKMRAEKE